MSINILKEGGILTYLEPAPLYIPVQNLFHEVKIYLLTEFHYDKEAEKIFYPKPMFLIILLLKGDF